MKNFSFLKALRSLFSVVIINLLIIYYKFKNKKIIFFYHPRMLLTSIHTFYIEDLFKDYHKNFILIYGHISKKKIGKNYFFIKESYLKFLLNVKIFMSSNLCDKFIKDSIKIYLSHDIYDAPLVTYDKEQKLCERFSQYDIIFLSSQNVINMFKEIFGKYNDSPKINLPILREIGYPKFDFIEKQLKNDLKSQKDSIIIAPTDINAFPYLTLINNLKELINELIRKTDFNIIYRPHPYNQHDPKILQIRDFFKSNNKFHYDIGADDSSIYSKSMFLITDQSDIAYMFAFLTMNPVIFFSQEEEEIKSYNYHNLNYFSNREKIGIVINQITSISEKINKLRFELKKYEFSILKLKKEIKYLGQSQKRFHDEIKNL